MKKLFLTSSIHLVAGDIAGKLNLSEGKKMVFVRTPVELEKPDDLGWLARDRESLTNSGFEVTDYSITDKSENRVADDLAEFDYIYVSGGNSVYMLEKSLECNFKKIVTNLLEKGKTYISTSAGSIIAGPKIPDYLYDENKDINLPNLDGYGLVNFTVVPHWGSQHFKERYLSRRLEIAFRESQYPLLLLTDYHYVQVTDSKIEIIDTYNK